MKKIIALSLALVMALGLMVGCSQPQDQPVQDTETSQEQPAQDTEGEEMAAPEPFTIGFAWDTANPDPNWISMHKSVQTAVEAAGGELVTVETDFTADTLINNVSELISRGVDGILFMPASDSMLPTVDAMCSEAGVYYATIFRSIVDPAIKEQIHSSEFFAGGCYEDDEACASNIVQSMAGMGVSNLVCINIAKGDTSSDLRDKGAAIGVEEAGINLLNTTYGITDTSTMTKTMESYIAAYPEMDGVLILGTYSPAALPTIQKTLEDHNLAGEVIEKGSFHVAYGGQMQIDTMMSTVILVNAVMGKPIQEGEPTILITPYLELTSIEDSNAYNEHFLGDGIIYTADEIKEKMIRYYNEDYDYDYFVELIESFSISDVVARHG